MIPRNTIQLVKVFEGFSPTAYLCPAGIATIGYGTIKYPNGKRVSLKDPPITTSQAEEYMSFELEDCVRSVLRLCPALEGDQLGAIVDFTYNLGVGNLQTSTLRRKINAGEWDEVPEQLNRWVYGGGRKLRGLVLRRAAEGSYYG